MEVVDGRDELCDGYFVVFSCTETFERKFGEEAKGHDMRRDLNASI